jgi:hypothetical protein
MAVAQKIELRALSQILYASTKHLALRFVETVAVVLISTGVSSPENTTAIFLLNSVSISLKDVFVVWSMNFSLDRLLSR